MECCVVYLCNVIQCRIYYYTVKPESLTHVCTTAGGADPTSSFLLAIDQGTAVQTILSLKKS